MPSETPFKGCEQPFFELYVNILGNKRVSEIIALHGFERSALYSLHNEAVKLKAIPKTQLLALADGNTEIIGFAFQPPSLAISWIRPFEHYQAEMILGKALHDPVNEV